MSLFTTPFLAKGIGGFVSLFIRWIIYDIIITGIVDIFGVSRMVALFIFLGITVAISIGGYILKQKSGASLDD